MTWQLCENQNVAALDQSMVERLEVYLSKREAQLCHQMLQAIQLLEGVPLVERYQGANSLHLQQVLDEFCMRLSRVDLTSRHKQRLTLHPIEEWKQMLYSVEDALWKYVEVLEGCVTELFQQVGRISFEYWNAELIQNATLIRDEMTQRIDDLIWGVLRLDKELKGRWLADQPLRMEYHWWQRVLYPWQGFIDQAIVATLQRCRKFLQFRYGGFVEKYTAYLRMCEGLYDAQSEFNEFRVYGLLELDQQDKIRHLYLLLLLWRINNKARVLTRNEMVRALRGCCAHDTAIVLFSEYYKAIRQSVFDKSRMIKKQFRLLFVDIKVRKPLLDSLELYRRELELLQSLIQEYYIFHHRTDPDIKARWFMPVISIREQALDKVLGDIKALDLILINFHASMECEPAMERRITPSLKQRIGRYLHEMAQPLASRDMMQKDAKELLNILNGLDEVGSFDPQVVDYVRVALVRALCSDWKYHVLHEMPLFHHLYDVHRNVSDLPEDRQHMKRFHSFQDLIRQLRFWLAKNQTLEKSQEIELCISDLKAYFQDFYTYVQKRLAERKQEGESVERAVDPALAEALLQYLYLFGSFFHSLHVDNAEERLLRKSFLFVDQYFEEIVRDVIV